MKRTQWILWTVLAAAVLSAPLWLSTSNVLTVSPEWFSTRVLSVSFSLRWTPFSLGLAALLSGMFPWVRERSSLAGSHDSGWLAGGLTVLTMATILAGNLVFLVGLWWLQGVLVAGWMTRMSVAGGGSTKGGWSRAFPGMAGVLALVAVLIPALYNHGAPQTFGLESSSVVSLGLWMTSAEFESMNPMTMDLVGCLLALALLLRAAHLWFEGRKLALGGVQASVGYWSFVLTLVSCMSLLWETRVLWYASSTAIQVVFGLLFLLWMGIHIVGALSMLRRTGLWGRVDHG